MTPPENNPDRPPGRVLDPRWEQTLRAGQEVDGGAGSVDAELAVIHLLRHARAPERLDEAGLERIWGAVEGAVAPVRWWRRPWVLWGAPAAAAAAALAIVIASPGPSAEDAAGPVAAGPAEAASTATVLARQFAALEPDGRRAIEDRVELGRGHLRAQLLATAGEEGVP